MMKKLKDVADRDGYQSLSRLLVSLSFNQRTTLADVYEYCDLFQRKAARTDEGLIDDIVGADIMEMLNDSGRIDRYYDEIDSGFEES